MAQRVNSEEFKSVLKSENTVLADFYSDSCIPCKRMLPVLTELESELGGKIKTVKINVALDGDLAAEYDVLAVPTFVLFKNGKETSRMIGAVPKEKLVRLIEQ